MVLLAGIDRPAHATPAQQQAECQAFKETGKSACRRFLQYWLGHGGLPQLGLPISDEFSERSASNGKTYTVQYFERTVLELHPENQPPYDVLLSLLGAQLYNAKYRGGTAGQHPDTSPGSLYFEKTGHRVGGIFLSYWQAHGGLLQQGYPISDPFQERSPLNGRTYTVQYFERAVFEYHLENQPPYDILLSQLGTLRLRQRYPTGEAGNGNPGLTPTAGANANAIQTVYVIVMENHNWSQIKGSRSAPFTNNVLLPAGSHAEQFYNAPGIHPSEPNYLWMEAGTNFGIADDRDPSANHLNVANHLTTLLNRKGISWKAYMEGISGRGCPLVSAGLYAAKHNPMVFFDDVTGGNDPNAPYCVAHERPYSEFSTDLQNGTVARYDFIVPDLCADMHNATGCATSDSVKNGDNWLANEVPKITGSQGYKSGGALFITWDEGAGFSDGPIGMVVLSPYAKGGGYSNTIHYTHSSTLRTIEEIFGLSPLLGGAAQATDLSDLFRVFP